MSRPARHREQVVDQASNSQGNAAALADAGHRHLRPIDAGDRANDLDGTDCVGEYAPIVIGLGVLDRAMNPAALWTRALRVAGGPAAPQPEPRLGCRRAGGCIRHSPTAGKFRTRHGRRHSRRTPRPPAGARLLPVPTLARPGWDLRQSRLRRHRRSRRPRTGHDGEGRRALTHGRCP
jgi:hypothetical protein